MDNSPLVLVGWMLVAMMVVGMGLTWGWSFWLLGLLGMGLLSLAYLMTRKTWSQACDSELKVRTSLDELRQVLDSQKSRSSLSSVPGSIGSEIQDIVEEIKNQIGK